MSRLDRHVAFVQGKLTTSLFVDSFAVAIAAFFTACSVAIVLQRAVQLTLPRPEIWLLMALGVAVAAALAMALSRKPSAHEAAIEIDRRLNLKEKFSTALYARSMADPFAVAAVRDAETAADTVSLYHQFPLTRPRHLWLAIVSAVIAGGLLWLLPKNMDLFGREAQRQKLAEVERTRAHAKEVVRQALATVSSYPKSLQSDHDVQLAKRDLENLLNQPVRDPEQTGRSAMKALQDANEAVKEQIKNNQQFATAQNEQRAFASMSTPENEKGPVAEAGKAMARGDFSKAAEQMKQATEQFNKMPPAQQQATAKQMQNLAQQLAKMASDPARQQELQQKLQQLGATPKQAQELQQTMQQAAQGNPQAQQKLQQMQQQMARQMNNGHPTPQQMQQMQQTLKQMQANANTQQTAQQMAQAAQQMAQAMQQSQQSQQQAQSQQGQPQSGQKGQSGQPGRQQQQQQAMANAQQQMQQQMEQMDAIAQDAREVAAAQESTDQASQDAADAAAGQPGSKGDANRPNGGNGHGEWKQGDPRNGNGKGAGAAGRGGGKADGITEAPYAVKSEVARSKDIATGRTLASTYVKAGTIKGEARVGLSKVAASALNDSTDDVDEQNVNKQSQQVVKQYFETMQADK